MSKRKQGRTQQTTACLQASVQRNLQRGDFKEALKNARVCYRKDATEENRLLLQSACAGRAEQLYQNGLSEQARGALVELDSLGTLPESLASKAVRLRVLLGLGGAALANGAGNSVDDPLAADPSLRSELADQAVLQGPGPACPVEIRGQAAQIRAVLEQTEAGDAKSESTALAAIDRRSPLADWKLFTRGLAAYYDNDDERTLANWRRLDANRPPHAIAQTLMLVAGLTREKDASAESRSRARRLASAAGESAIAVEIATLKRLWEQEDWSPLIRAYGRIQKRFHVTHPEVVGRLANWLCRQIMKDERDAELNKLARTTTGPPLDPKFHRVRALIAETDGDLPAAQKAWIAFLGDLERNPNLSDHDRPLAIGLVYQRLAGITTTMAQECEPDDDSPWGRMYGDADDEAFEALCERAEEYFERSLEMAPLLRDAYFEYAAALTSFGASARDIEQVYRRLLNQFPEDVDALLVVAHHYLEHNEPATAKKHARQAQRFRPRDEQVANMLWAASVSASRTAARNKEFAVARAELAEAEHLVGNGRERYLLDACRAAIEFKARNLDGAEGLTQKVVGQFDEPAAGLLLVSAQTFRVGIPRETRKDLNARLQDAIKRAKRSSQAAGVMARFLFSIEQTDNRYRGVRTHAKMLAKYVKACKRVRWEATDLIAVCNFLNSEEDEDEAFRRFAKLGRKRFPQEPYFHFAAGYAEVKAGPFACNHFKATQAFERAVELSKTAERPLDEEQRNVAGRFLMLLQGLPPMMPPMDDFWEDEYERYDDEGLPEIDFDNFDPSKMDLDEFRDSLPPDLRRKAELASKMTGVNILEKLRQVLIKQMQQEHDEANTHERSSRSRTGRNRSSTPY